MNRRFFIQSAISSALVAAGLQTRGWGEASHSFFQTNEFTAGDVRDLILWAPYEAFLPEQTDPVLSDPTDGTETGILKAADIIKGEALNLQYWHEHNGVYHRFTITPDNFTSLKSGNPVVIILPTTVVEDHYHMVVIDPNKPA